jgi:hypothetical protein
MQTVVFATGVGAAVRLICARICLECVLLSLNAANRNRYNGIHLGLVTSIPRLADEIVSES